MSRRSRLTDTLQNQPDPHAEFEEEERRRGLENVAAYVSRLKARRSEETASRKNRSQRRADTVNTNMEAFKRRSVAQRRRLMDEKLQMTSQIEHHLFSMLDEQSKWRHVMYQNVVDQENHLHEMQSTQADLDTTYLRGLETEEREVYAEVVADDNLRWETLHAKRQKEHDEEVSAICSAVMQDVHTLAEKVIDFDAVNDLGTDPILVEGDAPKPMFDRVPPIIFSEWVKAAMYPDAVQVEEKILDDHISLRVCRNVDIQDTVVDNGLFSALTLKLQQKHQPPPPLFKPVKALPKAIIILAGPKYSGKTTVGKQVAEQLNLWYVSDIEMLEAALQEVEREITAPVDPDDPNEAIRTELLDLGVEARRLLNDGCTLPDELMAKIILNRLQALELTEYAGILLDGAPDRKSVLELVEASLSGYDANRKTELPKKKLAPVLPVMPPPTDPLFTVERPPTPPLNEFRADRAANGNMQVGRITLAAFSRRHLRHSVQWRRVGVHVVDGAFFDVDPESTETLEDFLRFGEELHHAVSSDLILVVLRCFQGSFFLLGERRDRINHGELDWWQWLFLSVLLLLLFGLRSLSLLAFFACGFW